MLVRDNLLVAGRVAWEADDVVQLYAIRRQRRADDVAICILDEFEMLGVAIVGTPVDVQEAGCGLRDAGRVRVAGQIRFVDSNRISGL